jgi:hypothetical protein
MRKRILPNQLNNAFALNIHDTLEEPRVEVGVLKTRAESMCSTE